MIKLNNKKDCCGCSACANICPKNCIDMVSDSEGFLYPDVCTEKCIDCNLCVKSCPIITKQLCKYDLSVKGKIVAFLFDKIFSV